MATVRQFVNRCWRLINPSNPTQPLHGNDLDIGIEITNELLNSYASSGLMLTIAQTYNIPVNLGTTTVTVGPPTYLPTPDFPFGRLANLDDAWLLLEGVTYPLIQESRDNYLQSWKYEPLQGLPRFIISFPETQIVTLLLYPAPIQFFELYIRGKFQLANVTSDDTMDSLPDYYLRYLRYAVAKDLAFAKARGSAWTPDLEAQYREAKDNMEAASEVNLSITGDRASLLNGAWRVKSGI